MTLEVSGLVSVNGHCELAYLYSVLAKMHIANYMLIAQRVLVIVASQESTLDSRSAVQVSIQGCAQNTKSLHFDMFWRVGWNAMKYKPRPCKNIGVNNNHNMHTNDKQRIVG